MRFAHLISRSMAVVALLFISMTAFALEGASQYSADAFQKAQNSNKMIVVDIYKDGCGTCAKQKPALEAARDQYPDAEFFRVDFANDKQAVKKFKAIKQSTIIVFRGSEERGRVLGETNQDKILSMISKGAS